LTTQTSAGARQRHGRTATIAAAPGDVSEETILDLRDLFKMLADISRLKILMALSRNGPMHVNAICGVLGQSQPAVSHHLALLRSHHMVRCERRGKNSYYRIYAVKIRDILDQMFTEMGNGGRQILLDDLLVSVRKK
jgi:DNA-binding transcriptional ArsR family regulator